MTDKRALALFFGCLFAGLFYIFGLIYGIDPSDIPSAIINQLILGLLPNAGPYLTVIGVILAIVTFLGFVKLVKVAWDSDKQLGVAAFCGLLAGGLALIDGNATVPFWVVGLFVSVV
jgi:hypothetical protein